MALSTSNYQYYFYFAYIILTSIGTFYLYKWTEKEWVFYREAETKFANKEYAAAIDLYKKSMEKGVPFSKGAVNLANSYVAVGNFKEAIVLYKEYLLEHPKENHVRLELARALSYVGNLKESEVEYQKVLEDSHENNHAK